MGPSARNRERRRAGEESWKKKMADEDIQGEAKKTRMGVFVVAMFLILTFSFVSCSASFLMTYSYLERGKFGQATCSTDIYPTTSSSIYLSLPERMTIQMLEVVRMLLVMSGLETNPGTNTTHENTRRQICSKTKSYFYFEEKSAICSSKGRC